MRNLNALITHPFVRRDGSLVDMPCYDEQTGVCADFSTDSLQTVPQKPSQDDLINALRTLWRPWSAFSFASEADVGAMLSAVLTIVARPALRIAPAYMFDAPVPGSGKTFAASALGAIVCGDRYGITPYVSGHGAETEMSKRLVTMLMAGEQFWLIDNVTGYWKSAVMAGLLTSGRVKERLLGGNVLFDGSSRMMICATGNNASLDRDLGRRFIKIRIDPGMENPQSRCFTFNPVETALRSRLQIAQAALVLIRGHRSAGAPRFAKGDAGFDDWSALVRDCVLWIADRKLALAAGIRQPSDPALSIIDCAAANDADTEAHHALLRGLERAFQGKKFAARQVVDLMKGCSALDSEGTALVRDAFTWLLPGRPDLSPMSVGRILADHRDRVAGGRVLKHLGNDRERVGIWILESVKD